jgi:hypothetical protein
LPKKEAEFLTSQELEGLGVAGNAGFTSETLKPFGGKGF